MIPLNILLTKISILRNNRNDYEIYGIDELPDLQLGEDNYDHCRFIEVGKTLILENKKYKILNIDFRINPVGQTLKQDFNVHAKDTGMSNCALLVTVEEYAD